MHDAVCRSAVDLAFVLDSSGSINDAERNTWSRMLNFVAGVVTQFDVSRTTAHIGLIRYSDRAEIILHFNFTRLILLVLLPAGFCV